MIALAFTSSSRASSLIRTWFVSLRNLPFPPDPRRPSLSQALPLRQSFLQERLPPFRPRFHRSRVLRLPRIHYSRGPRLRFSTMRCSPPQVQLIPRLRSFQQFRLAQRPLLLRLHRSGSPPDKSCRPSSRQFQEFPSTAPASSPRVSRRW